MQKSQIKQFVCEADWLSSLFSKSNPIPMPVQPLQVNPCSLNQFLETDKCTHETLNLLALLRFYVCLSPFHFFPNSPDHQHSHTRSYNIKKLLHIHQLPSSSKSVFYSSVLNTFLHKEIFNSYPPLSYHVPSPAESHHQRSPSKY